MQLLIILVICAIAAALAFLLRYKIDKTLALACFSCIITVYFFGLIGIMAAGAYLCLALGGAGLIYLIWRTVKGGAGLWKKLIFTPGFAAFCMLGIIFVWWINRGRMLIIPDEFSHWGAVVKVMHIFDDFGTHQGSNLIFPSYLPGTAVFQYLWVRLCGQFSEHLLYRAMNFLLISLVIPFFSDINWRQKKAILPLMGAVVLIPLLLFSDYYTSLLVDAVLGLVMAYALVINFQSERLDKRLVFCLSLTLSVLALIKASGFGLALFTAAIIFVCRFRKPEKGVLKARTKAAMESLQNSNTPAGKAKSIFTLFKNTAPILIVLAPVLANYSWKAYTKAASVQDTWPGMKRLTGEGLSRFLLGKGVDWQYQAALNFFEGLFEKPIHTDFSGQGGDGTALLSVFQWILIFISLALIAILTAKRHEEKALIRRTSTAMLISGILYAGSLEILYLFTFHPNEALNLASFERYIGSFILGCGLPLCYLALRSVSSYNIFGKPKETSGKWMTVAAAALCVILCFTVDVWGIGKKIVLAPQTANAQAAERAGPKQVLEKAPPLDYLRDSVWVINQGTAENSWSPYSSMLYYELTPVSSVVNSIGTPYFDGDLRTLKLDAGSWRESLRGKYNYVYLYYVDDKFRQEFGDVFENPGDISDNAWFEVSDDGELLTLIAINMD